MFTNTFSQEVWENTYKYGDDTTIEDTWRRVAKDLASAEKDSEYWTKKFFSVLNNFRFVPGGRIISNAGTNLRGTTYINCFVSGPGGEDQDSMEGIFRELRKQGLILKSEGGYGFCADFLRPRGAIIGGIGNQTPGMVKFLELWDKQSEIITLGSGKEAGSKSEKKKIRKGAQMVTASCWHPDIIEFITAKQTPGRLTKFNMSVLITDKFVEACKKNAPWDLIYPDYQSQKDKYQKEWDGDLDKWIDNNGKIKVYSTFSNANELLDTILQSTYNRNEPGVLFVDTINRMNNLAYCERIKATNPCGEQVLPPGGCCLLGSINLTQYIKDGKWDLEKLSDDIPIIVRMMDNVNDLTYVPLAEQVTNLHNKRRIGLGVMGYGSALLMLKKVYGSKQAIKLTEDLMDFIANAAYQASALLAKEKGPFPLYDQEKYLNSNYIKVLSTATIELIKKYGIRNSHLLSIQPTGNTAVFANNVSGGLEPIFMPEYIRTVIVQVPPSGIKLPSVIWEEKQYLCQHNWQWEKEGDEDILTLEYENVRYKFDRSRGLTKEVPVQDYGVLQLDKAGEWDATAPWAKGSMGLTIDDHINTMKAFAKYIDSAMSKTINIPFEYDYEQFKQVYLKAHATGYIKGCTTYRVGTMASVLSAKATAAKIQKHTAPARPKSLPCDIFHITFKSKPWIAIVGLMDGEPYEIFAMRAKKLKLSNKIKNGNMIRMGMGKYDLELDSMTIEDICEHFESDEEESITRLISTSLRHGVDLEFIVDQLLKSKGTIMSFNRVIARTLKKYLKGKLKVIRCPFCRSHNMQMVEGCAKCSDCGKSQCE